MIYTIDRLKSTDIRGDVLEFFRKEAVNISEMFGNKFDYNYCPVFKLADNGILLICRRDGKITGLLLAFINPSVFDVNTKILQQQILYSIPNSGRTAYHLFKNFIDIGKSEANHIITMLTSQTNIKPETLKKLGFEELETLYRLEV